jgi:hypothetical protein
MTRVFLRSDDVRDLVTDRLGSDRGVVALDRLAGGSKKGVYRLRLIEGPLRIADTDFPDRQWMLDLAEWNITKALAAI